MVVLDKVTDMLLFFGKLLVVGGVGKGHHRGLQSRGAPWNTCRKGCLQKSSPDPGTLAHTGVLSFFFFSGRIKGLGKDFENPHLNYYWLPIMVSDVSLCHTQVPRRA